MGNRGKGAWISMCGMAAPASPRRPRPVRRHVSCGRGRTAEAAQVRVRPNRHAGVHWRNSRLRCGQSAALTGDPGVRVRGARQRVRFARRRHRRTRRKASGTALDDCRPTGKRMSAHASERVRAGLSPSFNVLHLDAVAPDAEQRLRFQRRQKQIVAPRGLRWTPRHCATPIACSNAP